MFVRERLAELIAWRGWKPPRLAERLKEHPNWVYNRLEGKVQVKADELPRVAEALGVSPADFFAEGPPTGAVPTAEALIQRAADLAVERVRGEIAEEVKAAVQNAIRRVVDVAAEGETEAANSTFGPSTYWPEGDSPEDAARETLIEGMFTEDERDLVRAIFRLRGKRRSGGTRPESLTERESETNSA